MVVSDIVLESVVDESYISSETSEIENRTVELLVEVRVDPQGSVYLRLVLAELGEGRAFNIEVETEACGYSSRSGAAAPAQSSPTLVFVVFEEVLLVVCRPGLPVLFPVILVQVRPFVDVVVPVGDEGAAEGELRKAGINDIDICAKGVELDERVHLVEEVLELAVLDVEDLGVVEHRV